MLILHLSDIHFSKVEVVTKQDPNHHLRTELVRDIEAICGEIGTGPDVILISGDIAFAGENREYEFATKWLAGLCVKIDAPMSSIFICPGNHDVVRKIADRAGVQALHDAIKATRDVELHKKLMDLLLDTDAARLLYESLDNYNAFAQQFLCDLLPPDRTRAFRDVYLNDGSILRLWGVNSCFVSSSADSERNLFVDTASLQITHEAGVENLVMTHHHLSWLRQMQAFEDHLNDVARIQVFGHVHTNRIARDPNWIRLTASAAHPDRREYGWEPGYNLVELHIEGTGAERWMEMRAHVRIWQEGPGRFVPKKDRAGVDVFEHSIKLDFWERGHVTVEVEPASMEASLDAPSHSTPEPGVVTRLREIGVRFYQLSFSEKSEIAGRLKLLEEEDMNQPDFERFRRVFLRAHSRGQLEELAQAISDAAKR